MNEKHILIPHACVSFSVFLPSHPVLFPLSSYPTIHPFIPQRQGYRVLKAHFKSSHCPLCQKEFQPGEHIGKPNGDQSRGGWAHTICLARQMEEEGVGKGGGKGKGGE